MMGGQRNGITAPLLATLSLFDEFGATARATATEVGAAAAEGSDCEEEGWSSVSWLGLLTKQTFCLGAYYD